MSSTMSPVHPPVRALEALRALGRLLRDPDRTEDAFAVVRLVDAGGIDRLFARFRQSSEGRALLRERPSLLAALSDTAGLAAMPEGSLGRTYLAFCEREGITPGGLVEASTSEERALLDEDRLYVADRMRDSHDLWHVITGCRTDLAGELSVLAFSTAQTQSLGVGLLALGGFLRSFTLPRELGYQGRELVKAAVRSGRRASWLPIARWEELLPLPLDEVRRSLRVEPLPAYEPFYKEQLAA
ncbi:MAG: Coq4 family protein [Sandaracinaceae bacterium]